MDEGFDEGMDTSADMDVSDADMSSDIPDDIPDDIPEDIPEDVPEDMPDDIPDDIPEDIPEDVPEDVSDDIEEDIPEDVPEDIPEDVPEDTEADVEDMAEDVPEDIPEDVSEDTEADVEDMTEDVPEDIPEDVDVEADTEEAPADVDEADSTDVYEEADAEETPADVDEADSTDVDAEEAPADVEDADSTDVDTETDAEEAPADVEDTDTTDVDAETDAEETPADVDDADSTDVDAEADTEEYPADVEDTDTTDVDAEADTEEAPADVEDTDVTDVEAEADTEEAPADAEDTDVTDVEAETDTEEAPTDVEDADTTGAGAGNVDIEKTATEMQESKSPMDQLSAYMSEHNYGPDDYAEYSQDPEWQRLHKEAFPDYHKDDTEGGYEAVPERHGDITPDVEPYHAIPNTQRGPDQVPLTSDVSADSTGDTNLTPMQKLTDYMNAHNYGPDDFAEYSQDPNWRLLHKEAYPNYEMPPLTQENAQRQLTQFMNDHNYGADDLDEYSQNPVWRELHKAAYPDYEMPEYDNSPEARELREMGIPNVDLRDCRPEYRGEVVDAVKDAISECPELKDQLTKVSCHEMSDGTYASYGPTQGNKKFGGCLNLNSKNFSSPSLQADLTEESKQGWSIPNSSPRSSVSHELGHGMHLNLCAKSCGLEYGKVPEGGRFNAAVQQYMNDVHADRIVEAACKDCNVQFDSWDFADHLTRYGATNYGEALAEAVAEVRNNAHPRPMASAIYRHLMNYKY